MDLVRTLNALSQNPKTSPMSVVIDSNSVVVVLGSDAVISHTVSAGASGAPR